MENNNTSVWFHCVERMNTSLTEDKIKDQVLRARTFLNPKRHMPLHGEFIFMAKMVGMYYIVRPPAL